MTEQFGRRANCRPHTTNAASFIPPAGLVSHDKGMLISMEKVAARFAAFTLLSRAVSAPSPGTQLLALLPHTNLRTTSESSPHAVIGFGRPLADQTTTGSQVAARNLLMLKRRRSESNRRIKVLQTSALPLGYAAEKSDEGGGVGDEEKEAFFHPEPFGPHPFKSGRRDLNPRLRPWQGRTLPLSYSRVSVLKFYRFARSCQAGPRKAMPVAYLTRPRPLEDTSASILPPNN